MDKRFWVYDRKVSDLSTFSAFDCRYWIIDRTTNLWVDESNSKTVAIKIARDFNKNYSEV